MTWKALAAALLLAGCAGSSPATTDTTTPTVDGQPQPSAGAPVITGFNWTVGKAWQHTFTIGNASDADKTEYTAAVVATEGTGWSIQSSTEEAAIHNAAFFLGSLGTMGAEGTLRHGDFYFPFYQFPLSDNMTWTAQESNISGADLSMSTQALTFAARWDPAAQGTGAYLIEARGEDGVRARYDYVPALGWFSKFETYGDGETYRVVAQAAPDYSGPAFDATADVLYSSSTLNPGPPAAPAGPNTGDFQMADGMTHLVIIQFAYGAPGAAATRIVAPDGTVYGTTSTYDHEGNSVYEDFSQAYVLAEAQPGQWTVAYEATGVFIAHAVIWANGITLVPFAA